MIRLYEEVKLSSVKIGKIFDCSASLAASLIKNRTKSLRSNKQNSRKFTYNMTYFNVIDTPEKAYWLGFIYADGYVQIRKDKSKIFGIALSTKDKLHLELLNDTLSSTYEVKEYEASEGNSYGTERYCRLQIFGEEIFDNMVKHGVVPNKTEIVKPPKINKKLYSHFIRGYIDGDGCITSSSNEFAVKILGTVELLDFIKEFIESRNIATIHQYYKRRPTDNVESIELAGNYQVKAFLDLIYKDSTVHLNRKHEKYIELCNLLYSRAT